MAVAVKVSTTDGEPIGEWTTDETGHTPKTRAPSLKRPENVSDTDWAIMRAGKNEDVAKRIADIIADQGKPCTPEEASVLMDIVSGAEMSELRTIRRLRESLAPKIKASAALANSLSDIKVKLFRLATAV